MASSESRDVARLEEELEAEKLRNKQLMEEIKQVKNNAAALQTQVEQEEEFISNKLMKRLSELSTEKQRLALVVEQEEEYITNKLQKQLMTLSREKAALEQRLATEKASVESQLAKVQHENHVLAQQVKQKEKEKVDLEAMLEQEQEYISNRLQHQIMSASEDRRALEAQVREVDIKLAEEHERLLRKEKEKVDLENQLEQEQEYISNRLQMKVVQVMAEKAALEQKLAEDEQMLQEKVKELVHQYVSAHIASTSSPSAAGSPACSPSLGSASPLLETVDEKLTRRMKDEAMKMRAKLQQHKKEMAEAEQRNETLLANLRSIQNKNFALVQQIANEKSLLHEHDATLAKVHDLKISDDSSPTHNTSAFRATPFGPPPPTFSTPPRTSSSPSSRPSSRRVSAASPSGGRRLSTASPHGEARSTDPSDIESGTESDVSMPTPRRL